MLLSDLRLTDIIVWKSQDDRMQRRGKKLNAWLAEKPGRLPSIHHVKWLPLLAANSDNGQST